MKKLLQAQTWQQIAQAKVLTLSDPETSDTWTIVVEKRDDLPHNVTCFKATITTPEGIELSISDSDEKGLGQDAGRIVRLLYWGRKAKAEEESESQ